MPTETATTVTAIVATFAVFAPVLAWADFQTSRARR